MDITDVLARTGALQSMAQELGMSEADAASGAAALVPAILGGLKKQAQAQPAGRDALGGMLGQLGGGSLLDDVLSPQPTDVARGNEVLGSIFGSKDVSRAVAQNAAAQSGLEPSLLKKMLPVLAMLVTGFMAKQAGGDGAGAPGATGGLGGLLGGLLGRGQSAATGTQGGPAAGLAAMLDLDGDGNPLDDILGMLGRAGR